MVKSMRFEVEVVYEGEEAENGGGELEDVVEREKIESSLRELGVTEYRETGYSYPVWHAEYILRFTLSSDQLRRLTGKRVVTPEVVKEVVRSRLPKRLWVEFDVGPSVVVELKEVNVKKVG